jgi:hypothetical protein
MEQGNAKRSLNDLKIVVLTLQLTDVQHAGITVPPLCILERVYLEKTTLSLSTAEIQSRLKIDIREHLPNYIFWKIWDIILRCSTRIPLGFVAGNPTTTLS